MFDSEGGVRDFYAPLVQRIGELGLDELSQRQHAAERALRSMGITFNTWKEGRGEERIFPFDVVPRLIPAHEWTRIDAGLKQRIRALNLFIGDVYGKQRILHKGVVPAETVFSSPGYRRECMGLRPPGDIWAHVTGTDLIRHSDGQYYVLEDNLRVPSGVAYVLGNREVMKRTFPNVFDSLNARPVFDYPLNLRQMLQHIAPVGEPTIGVLTPGIFNGAYFEHSFLAQQMGVQLLEGHDLVVQDGVVQMRTTRGFERVDVLYRRIDDSFLDPAVFRPDSLLGVRGLMEVYRAGRIAIANAPGTGVADDKVIYACVPDMIRYYLDEDPILPNVPTYLCEREKDRQHVLENIADLVVKPANEAGGYGLLIGPHATAAEHEDFRNRIKTNPREYIAQPVMSLSRVPTMIDDKLEGRHVDLRPFIICGEETYVMPGGLCRVALRRGSLVVNSSQGGGSKDCWIVEGGD
ncbi:MAG: circularly permuted type 2 ATP-grasp protein [Leptospiraceae bacterium]|nr:circularly permuted type 2 ATP-grasp protein [Leptospiraceae bacterium]